MVEMILDILLSNVLEIVAAIISLIAARILVPYIEKDLIPWLKEKRIYNTVNKFVKAVEKMAESGIINKVDKKQKVIELLAKKGIVVDESVDAFIESCVKDLDLVTSVVVEAIKNGEQEEIESE